jgi:hypothetical protein
MNIRTEIRKTEKHIKSMTSDKNEQIAIISKAQGMVGNVKDAERYITILAIAKKRIINS